MPVFCGDRFCPVCSVIRRARVRRRLEWLIKCLPVKPEFRFRHLTLTIASQGDLRKMIQKLQADFRRLRQRAYWKLHVDGGAFVIEVTGRPGAWHAHIHAVIWGYWMKWEIIQQLWKKISHGTGCYITHIPTSAVVGYLTKYLSKPESPDIVTADISCALSGMRLFAPFGSWHNLNKLYVKPVHPCSKCGHTAWMQTDIAQGNFPKRHYVQFDESGLPPPKPKPVAASVAATGNGFYQTPRLDVRGEIFYYPV